jgi:L-alanine-DL-glutamate epimerase-like enolase superfamily enzyme
MMKIKDIKTNVVSVPYRKPERWSWGHRRGGTFIILQVLTDSGIVGLGEITSFIDASYVHPMIETIKKILVGEDPTNVELLMYKLGAYGLHNVANLVVSGVEMALLDIAAKEIDKPLYRLLGGCFRREVPFAPWLLLDMPEKMVKEAEKFVNEGFKTFYIKVGVDEKLDYTRVKAIRESLGDEVKIRIDANGGWAVGEAVRNLKRLEEFDIEFAEEPTTREGLARVREASNIPVASGDSATTLNDIYGLLMDKSVDLISHIDPGFQGGILASKKACSLCEAAEIPVVAHTKLELGIGLAAILHLVASTPNFFYPNQALYMYLESDVILGDGFVFEGGALKVPEGPGLGVELDRKKVEKYEAMYKQVGTLTAYGDVDLSRLGRPLLQKYWL